MSNFDYSPRGILDSLIAAGRVENRGATPSQSPGDELRQISTNDQQGDILNRLVAAGLVENFGARQKNPRRVAAARRQHANARRAKREAKELAAPIDPPRCHRRPGFKPIGTRMYDQIVRRMVPGHWYSRGDLASAAGFGMNARGSLMRSLLAGALATRARNPQADTGTSTRPAPQWLYRLTAKGEALRDLCRLLA